MALACVLFTANSMRDWMGLREFESQIAEMADAGGGVLFVMSPADCLATAELAGWLANEVQAAGIAVKGLVVRDWVDDSGLRLVMDAANKRFVHVPIGARGAVAFVGIAGTPVALGIASDGTVGVMERFGPVDEGEARGLAERLVGVVRDGP